MTMRKLIESIDKLNEATFPPLGHPDWELTPQERIAKQNERIAADSAADAEVWHKGMKPAETKDTKFAGQGVAEGVEIVDQDIDLDQQVFTLSVDGKTVSFTYWDYENNFQNPDIKDIYQQAREQLDKKLSPEQIKAVARSVFKSFKSDVAEGWKGKLAGAALSAAALISGPGCTRTSDDEWCQKPAEKVKEDGPIKDYSEWKKQILAKHPTAKFRRDPNGTDAVVDGKSVGQWDKFGGDQIEESPQSLRGALNNALSKAEPGSKLDKKIKHHNSMVKQFGKGTLDKAPEGYHMDKKGMIRLGEGKTPQKDTATWLADVNSSIKGSAKVQQSNTDAMKKAAKDKKKKKTNEGYTITPGIDREKYTDLSGEGLEGPFQMKNGQVLYYDPKQGQYYNRDTDMFVDYDDYQAMNEESVDEMAAHKKGTAGYHNTQANRLYKNQAINGQADDETEKMDYHMSQHRKLTGKNPDFSKTDKKLSGTSMYEDEELTELSRGKLNDYMKKASDDSQKNFLDPSKRSAEKRNRTVSGVKNAFNKLHLQGMAKVPATESTDNRVSQLKTKIQELASKMADYRSKGKKLKEEIPAQASTVQTAQGTTGTTGTTATSTATQQGTTQQTDTNANKILPPAEQMKGFLQALKAPGAIDQALRNLK